MADFDEEGFSATVKFTSPDADGGSMTSHLVRGMVSRQSEAPGCNNVPTE